jgi:hypothetical protein
MRCLSQKISVTCIIRIYQKHNGLDPTNAVKEIIMNPVTVTFVGGPFDQRIEVYDLPENIPRQLRFPLLERPEIFARIDAPIMPKKTREAVYVEKQMGSGIFIFQGYR